MAVRIDELSIPLMGFSGHPVRSEQLCLPTFNSPDGIQGLVGFRRRNVLVAFNSPDGIRLAWGVASTPTCSFQFP